MNQIYGCNFSLPKHILVILCLLSRLEIFFNRPLCLLSRLEIFFNRTPVAEVGRVTLKSNAEEALSNDFFKKKSNVNEAFSNAPVAIM
jgi:hypothetical protein